MKTLQLAACAALLATPALAETSSTLQAVTTRGVVMQTRFGFDVPITYAADGTFTAQPPGQSVSGTWRIVDGRTLCTRLGADPTETCATYPDGKQAGDAFELDGAMGEALGKVTVRIR